MKQEQDAQPTAQEIHETLYDGVDVSVSSSSSSSSSSIKVRKLPWSEFRSLALAIEDESEAGALREAALYCGQDEVWARSLDQASLDCVLAEGQRLNFSGFACWFRRQARLPQLLANQEPLVRLAMEALTRLQPRESTNGSSPRAIPIPISGVTRPTS